MKARSSLLLLVLGILASSALYARDDVDSDNRPTMDTVVITATKTKEKIENVPNNVIVMDSIDIEESPTKGVGELIADEPGVDLRSRGNYGGANQTIQIRGMEDDEVQVLLNGISLNSPSLGSADLSGIGMAGIDQVEISKGSGSYLYGSGAMAGTINIITKDPTRDQTDLKALLGIGQYNTKYLAVENGLFLSDNFGYYLTAHRETTDGQRDNGDLDQNDASLKLVYDARDQFKVSFYGYYLDKTFGKPGVVPESGTTDYYVNGKKFYDADSASLVDRGQNQDNLMAVDFETNLTPDLKLKIKQTYTNLASIDNQYNNANSWTSVAGTGTKTWVINTVTGLEGNLELNLADSTDFLLGVDSKKYKWKYKTASLDLDDNETVSESADHDIQTTGLFLQAQVQPTDRLRLLAGARQEQHSTFGSETLPQAGIVFKLNDENTIKVNHGKHFKAPTPNDLFWPEDDFVRGNPDLKPQTGYHSDITYEAQGHNRHWQASVAYFQWNVDNKIDWAENPDYPGPWGNKWTPTNLNKSTGSGLEAELKFNPSYAVSMGLSYTYTDAKDITESVTRSAQYVPANRLKGKMTYRFGHGMTVGATIHYVGDRDFYRATSDKKPTDTLSAYTIADVIVQKQFRRNWTLTGKANNLLDTEYETYVGSYTDKNGSLIYGTYPGGRRTLVLELSYLY